MEEEKKILEKEDEDEEVGITTLSQLAKEIRNKMYGKEKKVI